MTRVPAACAAAACALLLLGGGARADRIGTIDGKVYEGTVTRGRDAISVRLRDGKTVKVPLSEMKYHEVAELSWKVFERMRAAVAADAPDFVQRQMELAVFCRENLLEDLMRKCYEAVLQKEPAHREAHLGLGEVEFAGRWFKNEKGRDDFRKSAPADAMTAAGFVKYKGLWTLKEDADRLEKGLKLYRGKWMTEDEIQEVKGFVRGKDGKWLYEADVKASTRTGEVEKILGEKPPSVMVSPHFRFVSWFPVGETARFKEKAEKAYAWIRKEFGLKVARNPEDEEDDLFSDPIEVFALVTGERKDKWLDAFGPGYGFDAAAIDWHRKGVGWHRLTPGPYFILGGSKTEKNRGRSAEEDQAHAESQLTSMVGRIALDRIRGGQAGMDWLGEAVGFLTEIQFNETADCCYVSQSKYREEVVNKSGSRAKYWDFAKAQMVKRVDRSLREIFCLELNRLDWADTIKAWAFLDYLRTRYAKEFRSLMQAPFLQPEEITPDQIRAALNAVRPKDPADAAKPDPRRKKEAETPVPEAPIRLAGAQITEGSREERAVRSAACELWLKVALGKDLPAIEAEFKDWVIANK